MTATTTTTLTLAQLQMLRDLRAAAAARDAEQVQYALKRLIGQMDYYAGLALTLETLHRLVEVFESYDESLAWVRKALVHMAAYGRATGEDEAEAALSQRPAAPGAANYLKAVYDVTQAMNTRHTAEARISFLASALVNGVMAEVAEAWYGERLDDWETVRANQTDEAAQIAYTFWMDAGTIALERASWHEIADRLEAALKRQLAS